MDLLIKTGFKACEILGKDMELLKYAFDLC